jgi:2'-hydroxyisoflavone reductase
MTDVLVLGGTGWVSGRVAAEWVRRGARVTCVGRGSRPAPSGAALHIADRDDPRGYDVLATREWDEVVDVSSEQAHVAGALAMLAGRTRHWTYVSSVSVYAAADRVGDDESAELVAPAASGEAAEYPRAKAAAEKAVHEALADRAAVIRPGLIIGEGDPTDRFGYWVSRFALAGDGPVLVPAGDRRSQVIDVADLADFVVDAGGRGWVGEVDAVGPSTPLRDVIADARRVAGHTGAVVAASDVDLLAHDVAYWAGPRSLPLWIPSDMAGFATRLGERYRRAGGRTRPLETTLAEVLADERARGLGRERRAGLARADELAIIAALGVRIT